MTDFDMPLQNNVYSGLSVNLGHLILSTSDAIDLAFSSLAKHQQRVAFISWQLAKTAALEETRIRDVFLTGLLHDIGALSSEDKKALHDNETKSVEEHCIRGSKLFKSNPWLSPCADLVLYHHRKWEAWEEAWDVPTVFDSQLLFLSDYLERIIDRDTYILHQHEDLCNRLKKLSGKQISKEVIDLFFQTATREEFWLDLASPRLYSILLNNGPFQNVEVDIDNILIFAKLLGMIVDFKSPFTAAHSFGVARCSVILAEMTGMSAPEIRLMEIAGLLHDLGKLVIPNSILEKPSKLTAAEMAVMKQHPYYTFSVLSPIKGLEKIAEWASCHHEILNGGGYPFRRNGEALNTGSRIIAVSDIFTALAEDRPYRKGMDSDSVKSILKDMASRGLQDHRIVNDVVENIENIRKEVMENQAQVRYSYNSIIEKYNKN